MILCCLYTQSAWSISDYADLSNIIIAVVNLSLAYYIFIYQRNKDKNDKIETLTLQEQNIRLQWFKELIVQPHLNDINSFYIQLHSIENRFTSRTISDDEKIEIITFIKSEQSKLRKTFGDVLLGVNPKLHIEVKTNLDNLIDSITNVIFNDGLNLNHKPTFDKEIGTFITYSRNDLISKIYSYKGN
ncbi:MAG: hypothetical protein A3F72_14090 [Bacteroidetes bacterium RIFCSPLOWO2_12_FULL_35_15]|nr:MAG: hypothetical protein A3F72_14090 [Bacteroidetes bacterium RIFCSPLOWO2_12_FULL_35_15]